MIGRLNRVFLLLLGLLVAPVPLPASSQSAPQAATTAPVLRRRLVSPLQRAGPQVPARCLAG